MTNFKEIHFEATPGGVLVVSASDLALSLKRPLAGLSVNQRHALLPMAIHMAIAAQERSTSYSRTPVMTSVRVHDKLTDVLDGKSDISISRIQLETALQLVKSLQTNDEQGVKTLSQLLSQYQRFVRSREKKPVAIRR